MMRRFFVAYVLAAVFSMVVALPGAFCQEQQSSFSLHLSPVMDVPLGDSLTYYRFVGGGAFSAEYRLPFFPLLFIDGGWDTLSTRSETPTSRSNRFPSFPRPSVWGSSSNFCRPSA
jgi:hypothetical protein